MNFVSLSKLAVSQVTSFRLNVLQFWLIEDLLWSLLFREGMNNLRNFVAVQKTLSVLIPFLDGSHRGSGFPFMGIDSSHLNLQPDGIVSHYTPQT